MKKRLPKMKTDRAARKALQSDLSEYINREVFSAASFEFAPKSKSITLRISEGLLKAIRDEAERRGVNYQKLIREAIERHLRKAA